MNTDSENTKKLREYPHILVILMAMIALSAILTWVLPAGSYARITDPATGYSVIDPESFQYTERMPVSAFDMFVCLEESLITTADIAFMIFCVFSSLYVIGKTGAMDAIFARTLKAVKNQPERADLLIVLMIVCLSLWSSTGTLSYEEIFPFIPIFVTLSIALGYDALVGISISVIPVGIGFASATTNPFTIGVAQSIAGLPLYSGLLYRTLVLLAMTVLTVIYVMCYAKRVKKNPASSLLHDIDYSGFHVDKTVLDVPLTAERFLILASLAGAVLFMTWGLKGDDWHINQVASVFMILAIVSGILSGWKANRIASVVVEGLGQGALPAFIVGVGRAVSIILEKGHIMDTLIYLCLDFTEKLSIQANSFLMLVFQTLLNLFIPSGSAQATASMPFVIPVADTIGISRQTAVLIFQFGDGFSNLLWPTSFMLVVCAMAKIPLYRYYKWLLPFMGLCFIAQCLFVFGAISIGY